MTPKKALFALPALLLSFLASTATAPAQTAAAPETHPAPQQTVVVTGRVSSAENGLYIKNAEVRLDGTNNAVYTEDGGVYTILVPSGTVSLTATYTGVQSATLSVEVGPGKTNTLDFDLKPYPTVSRVGPGTGTEKAGDVEIVMLERFTVQEERDGQAKAIMEQRAAANAVTVIAIDNFGDLTSGSVGEFLKYMPGVTVDYDEDEASTVRVGGLDPKYAGFSMDGVALASGYGTTRANSFSQMSVTGIESIEFNQTLLARMPANTPAGKFELKTKYAFNRKKPELRFSIGLDGSGQAIEFGRNYMPDDKKHYRVHPGGQISYGGAFLKRRLGVEVTLSRYANYRNNQSHETKYSYLNPHHEDNADNSFVYTNGNLEMKEGPTIQGIVWREGPKIWTQSAANLNVDFKITPNLTFSLRNNFVRTENEYYNSYYELRASEPYAAQASYTGPSNAVQKESTLTNWIVIPVSPGGTMGRESIFLNSSWFRHVRDTNYLISPRLAYKKGSLEIKFLGSYSHSRRDYKDGDEGFFRGITNRMQGIGWEATRSSSDSAEWYITHTHGTHWSESQNYDRTDTYYAGLYSQQGKSENKQTAGYLDFTYALPVLGHPVTLRGGIGYLYSDYYYDVRSDRFTYIGPEGHQQGATLPSTENYVFDLDLGGKAGNINEQGFRVNNLFKLWDMYESNPEYFTVAYLESARNAFLAIRDLDEKIESAYVEGTTRAGKFQFNAGFRAERTKTEIMTTKMRTWGEIEAAKAEASPEELASGKFNFTTDDEDVTTMRTYAGFLYQYYDGQRFPRTKEYTNTFLSGGLKYDFTKNLRFQLSASQAILRPDYDTLSRAMSYSTTYRTNIWVPNPLLKPEKTLKVYAGLHYYFSSAGYISLSAYRLDIDDLQVKDAIITKERAEEQVGYAIDLGSIGGGEEEGEGEGGGGDGDDELGGIMDPDAVVFRSTVNAKGTRTLYGVTFEYNQQLTFLPGVLKGLSVFGSVSTASMRNVEDDVEKVGRAKTSANGGIRYRYGRFNVTLRAVWTDDQLVSVTQPATNRRWLQHDHQYQKARTVVDLSGGWKLNKNLDIAFSIRNLTNSPNEWYSNTSERLSRYQTYGSIWSVKLNGRF